MTIQIPTAHLVFNLPLAPQQIKRWRGAFVEMAGREYDWLHNHAATEDSKQVYRRYPRIQYRVANHAGQRRQRHTSAAIFGVGEGEKLLRQLIATPELDWVLNWNKKATPLSLSNFQLKTHRLCISTLHTYRLKHWLALNSKNYQIWMQCNGLVERLQLLEKLLNNHLIATLWAIGWPKDGGYIQAHIQDYRQEALVRYHEKFVPFSVTFSVNMQLPPLIAIGKGVSHGFGVIFPKP